MPSILPGVPLRRRARKGEVRLPTEQRWASPIGDLGCRPLQSRGIRASEDAKTSRDFLLWRSAVGGAPRQQFGSCALSLRRQGAGAEEGAEKGPRGQDGAVDRLSGRTGTFRGLRAALRTALWGAGRD